VLVINGDNFEPTKIIRKLSLTVSVTPPDGGKTQTVIWRPPGFQVQVAPLTRHDAGETRIEEVGWNGEELEN